METEKENSLVQVRSNSKNYTEKNNINAEVLAGSHLQIQKHSKSF